MRRKLKIRIWLDKKYSTAVALARSCGKSDQWISRIITGRDNPSDRDKKLICDKLGIPVSQSDDLFKDSKFLK